MAQFNSRLKYEKGVLIGATVVVHDITARKESEAALRGITDLNMNMALAKVQTKVSLGDIEGAATSLGEASKDNPGLYTAAVEAVPELYLYAISQKFYEYGKLTAILAIILSIFGFVFYRIFMRYLRPPALA